MVYVQDK